MRLSVQIPNENTENDCEHRFSKCESIFTRLDDSVKVFKCRIGNDGANFVAVKCTGKTRSGDGEKNAREAIPPEILTRYTSVLTIEELGNVEAIEGLDEHISYSRAFENAVTIMDLAFVNEDAIAVNNAELVQACINKMDNNTKLSVLEELKDTIYTVFAYLYSKGFLHYDIKVDNVIAHTSDSNIRFAVLDFDLCGKIGSRGVDDGEIARGHMPTKSVRTDSGPILTVHDLAGDTNMVASEEIYVALNDPEDHNVTYFNRDVDSEIQSIGVLLQTAATEWLGLEEGTYDLGSKLFSKSTPKDAGNNIGYTFKFPTGGTAFLTFSKLNVQRAQLPVNVVNIGFGGARATANLAASAFGLLVCGIAGLAGALRLATDV